MYFDFDDRYTDIEPVGSAINRRDGVMLSIVVHALIVALMLLAPELGIFQPDPEAVAAVAEPEPVPPPEERPRFVFVQPQLDLEAPEAPPRAELSDQDRVARSVEVPTIPENELPVARGNSAERVEAAPELRARGRGPAPEPTELPPGDVVQREPERVARAETPSLRPPTPATPPPQAPAGGSLGEALRNLQKYVEQESFNNPRGLVQDLGPLQFDTKGVEFGPWIRRFIAQVRRNWFIPYSAMAMRGKVVLQFNVHKNGRITDLTVVGPSSVDSFNTSAFNALAASNPTEPLPPEYPDDKAFFTVTFYYNESPTQP